MCLHRTEVFWHISLKWLCLNANVIICFFCGLGGLFLLKHKKRNCIIKLHYYYILMWVPFIPSCWKLDYYETMHRVVIKILLLFFLCVQRKYNSTRNGENNLNLRMIFAKQFYLNYMYTQTQIIFSNMWYTISTFKKTRKHSGLLQLRLKSVEGIRPFFIV